MSLVSYVVNWDELEQLLDIEDKELNIVKTSKIKGRNVIESFRTEVPAIQGRIILCTLIPKKDIVLTSITFNQSGWKSSDTWDLWIGHCKVFEDVTTKELADEIRIENNLKIKQGKQITVVLNNNSGNSRHTFVNFNYVELPTDIKNIVDFYECNKTRESPQDKFTEYLVRFIDEDTLADVKQQIYKRTTAPKTITEMPIEKIPSEYASHIFNKLSGGHMKYPNELSNNDIERDLDKLIEEGLTQEVIKENPKLYTFLYELYCYYVAEYKKENGERIIPPEIFEGKIGTKVEVFEKQFSDNLQLVEINFRGNKIKPNDSVVNSIQFLLEKNNTLLDNTVTFIYNEGLAISYMIKYVDINGIQIYSTDHYKGVKGNVVTHYPRIDELPYYSLYGVRDDTGEYHNPEDLIEKGHSFSLYKDRQFIEFIYLPPVEVEINYVYEDGRKVFETEKVLIKNGSNSKIYPKYKKDKIPVVKKVFDGNTEIEFDDIDDGIIIKGNKDKRVTFIYHNPIKYKIHHYNEDTKAYPYDTDIGYMDYMDAKILKPKGATLYDKVFKAIDQYGNMIDDRATVRSGIECYGEGDFEITFIYKSVLPNPELPVDEFDFSLFLRWEDNSNTDLDFHMIMNDRERHCFFSTKDIKIDDNYIKLNYDYTKHGSNGREKEPEIMTMLGFHDKYCNFAFTNYSGKSINEDVEVVVYKRDYDEFGDIEIIEYDRIIIEPEMISGNKTVYLGYCHNNEWYKDVQNTPYGRGKNLPNIISDYLKH